METQPLAAAQGALLMTLWCALEAYPSKPNTTWLIIAIDHARSANAHLAWEPGFHLGITGSGLEELAHDLHMLKRLWWCCIIRDRFLSLGMRRSMQIAKSYPILDCTDFDFEIEKSEVHSAETKRRLVELVRQLMRLCNILTGLLGLMFPMSSKPGCDEESRQKLHRCRVALQDWHKERVEQTGNMGRIRQRPEIIQTNLMHMFYL